MKILRNNTKRNEKKYFLNLSYRKDGNGYKFFDITSYEFPHLSFQKFKVCPYNSFSIETWYMLLMGKLIWSIEHEND